MAHLDLERRHSRDRIKAMDLALYIHVPFCLHRCAYCDFVTYDDRNELLAPYAAALLKDLQRQARRLTEQNPELRATTLYFGGGTPSLLSAQAISALIQEARKSLYLAADAEVTLEANPGALHLAQLPILRSSGVNRLSLGVQSANENELRLLGRIHSWKDATDTAEAARKAGFGNLSLDLIFGLPGQTLAEWQHTIEAALTLAPQHLSLYALTLELGSPLFKAVRDGNLPEPDPDLAADMVEWATDKLLHEGFWQYEISNWALGSELAHSDWPLPPNGNTESIGPWISRHNLLYWRNATWLGVGVAAHSYVAGHRWHNVHSPEAYISAVITGESVIQESEEITRPLEISETMMMGLRLAEGITETDFHARFGVGLAETYGTVIETYRRYGLLEWDGARVRLSARGRLLGNQVFEAFLQ